MSHRLGVKSQCQYAGPTAIAGTVADNTCRLIMHSVGRRPSVGVGGGDRPPLRTTGHAAPGNGCRIAVSTPGHIPVRRHLQPSRLQARLSHARRPLPKLPTLRYMVDWPIIRSALSTLLSWAIDAHEPPCSPLHAARRAMRRICASMDKAHCCPKYDQLTENAVVHFTALHMACQLGGEASSRQPTSCHHVGIYFVIKLSAALRFSLKIYPRQPLTLSAAHETKVPSACQRSRILFALIRLGWIEEPCALFVDVVLEQDLELPLHWTVAYLHHAPFVKGAL